MSSQASAAVPRPPLTGGPEKPPHRRGRKARSRTPVVSVRSEPSKRKKDSGVRSALKDAAGLQQRARGAGQARHPPSSSEYDLLEFSCHAAGGLLKRLLPSRWQESSDLRAPDGQAASSSLSVLADSAAALRHSIGYRAEPAFVSIERAGVDIGTFNMLVDMQHREITPEDFETLRRESLGPSLCSMMPESARPRCHTPSPTHPQRRPFPSTRVALHAAAALPYLVFACIRCMHLCIGVASQDSTRLSPRAPYQPRSSRGSLRAGG
jgi:hypothetical protein